MISCSGYMELLRMKRNLLSIIRSQHISWESLSSQTGISKKRLKTIFYQTCNFSLAELADIVEAADLSLKECFPQE